MTKTYRPQGDANFYVILDAPHHWLAQVQLNGELSDADQQKIMDQLVLAPDLLRFAEIAASGNTDYDDLIAMAKALVVRAGGAS